MWAQDQILILSAHRPADGLNSVQPGRDRWKESIREAAPAAWLASFVRTDCVSADAAEALFRVIDATYEKRSIAISSNIHPSGFDELMPKRIGVDDAVLQLDE